MGGDLSRDGHDGLARGIGSWLCVLIIHSLCGVWGCNVGVGGG